MAKRTLLEEIAEAERHACVSMAVSLAELKPLVQALADVRTLDEWTAQQGEPGAHRTRRNQDPSATLTWVCSLVDRNNDSGWAFYGATPDEARAKAAAWVRGQGK